jgi:hypothetical protein
MLGHPTQFGAHFEFVFQASGSGPSVSISLLVASLAPTAAYIPKADVVLMRCKYLTDGMRMRTFLESRLLVPNQPRSLEYCSIYRHVQTDFNTAHGMNVTLFGPLIYSSLDHETAASILLSNIVLRISRLVLGLAESIGATVVPACDLHHHLATERRLALFGAFIVLDKIEELCSALKTAINMLTDLEYSSYDDGSLLHIIRVSRGHVVRVAIYGDQNVTYHTAKFTSKLLEMPVLLVQQGPSRSKVLAACKKCQKCRGHRKLEVANVPSQTEWSGKLHVSLWKSLGVGNSCLLNGH